MAIELYSKATLDTLLAAKLADAPSDGSTYGRKDGAWEAIVAGSATWGAITGDVTAQTDLTTYLSSNYYPLTGNPSGFLTSVPGKTVYQAPYGGYTLTSTDANNIVSNSGNSGSNIVIPQDSTYNFPIGTVIIVVETSNGNSVVPEVYGGAVAPFINGGVASVSIGYGVTCVKIAADTWFVF
jgi:hypothetical protein